MSTKYVSDTPAGKSISAWIILKRHRHIATVRAHFSDSGVCTVNVFNHGETNRSAALNCQFGKASGYGYDKLTAALSGLEIDGHKMGNHCQHRKNPPPGGVWPRGAKCPRGWHFANWKTYEWVRLPNSANPEDTEKVDLPPEKQGWTDCYRHPGLKLFTELGYSVIQAI